MFRMSAWSSTSNIFFGTGCTPSRPRAAIIASMLRVGGIQLVSRIATLVPANRLAPEDHKTRKGRSDANRKAGKAVKGECSVVFIEEKLDVFEGKSGEGREPAAEAGSKKDTPFAAESGVPLGDPDRRTHDETTENVYEKCSEWEHVGKRVCDQAD